MIFKDWKKTTFKRINQFYYLSCLQCKIRLKHTVQYYYYCNRGHAASNDTVYAIDCADDTVDGRQTAKQSVTPAVF